MPRIHKFFLLKYFISYVQIFEEELTRRPSFLLGGDTLRSFVSPRRAILGLYFVFVKSNLHYTCRIPPKRVTSGGAHLCGLAPGQHSSEETSQRWQVVGDTV